MVSHIVGGAVGIVALSLCVIFAAIHKNVYGVVGSAIYGASMIILYTMSSIYHGLKPELTAKKVFQIIDHCSIFLLISEAMTCRGSARFLRCWERDIRVSGKAGRNISLSAI